MANMTSYAETRENFSLEIPEKFNFTRDVMGARAAENPDKIALIAIASDGVTINKYSFGQLFDMANRTAHLLRQHGVGKGDKVFVQVPRIVEFYAALLGCFQIGAVPMPGTNQLMAKDQKYRIESSGAIAVVCDESAAERFDTVRDQCPTITAAFIVGDEREGWIGFNQGQAEMSSEPAEAADTTPTDPLLLYFTSGTTGGPKMVQHVGMYALGHEITARFWHDLTPDDIHWTVSDTGWAKAAWGKLFGQWIVGSCIVMWNVVGKPDLDRMLTLISELDVTTFCAPPTLYRAFAQMDLSSYDWSTLRHCTSAGEPLNPEVIETWSAHTGTTPYDGYGQTETVVLVANYPSEPVKPGSMGLPAPGMVVDVVDDDGNICGDDVEGNICVSTEPRPIGLFDGYWQDDARTAEVFRNGWYYTGDRAFRDEDGYLWFVGRADDVILSAAYRIGPFEVESSLIEHPAVAETAVVGKPDEERGNIVKAFVILAPGYEGSDELTAEIQNHVKTTTAPYKYPREIEYVTELPKTISGKIRRVELRERDK